MGYSNDWSIFVDVDVLIHPETFDATELLDRRDMAFNGLDRFENSVYYVLH